MHGSIPKVWNQRLIPSKAINLIGDFLWYVRPHSPGTTRLSSDERE